MQLIHDALDNFRDGAAGPEAVLAPHEGYDGLILEALVPFFAREWLDAACGLQLGLGGVGGLECDGEEEGEAEGCDVGLDGGVEGIVPAGVGVEGLIDDPDAVDVIWDEPAEAGVDEEDDGEGAFELIDAEEEADGVAPPGIEAIDETCGRGARAFFHGYGNRGGGT